MENSVMRQAQVNQSPIKQPKLSPELNEFMHMLKMLNQQFNPTTNPPA
jgi:hypothetical protein